MSLQDTDDAVTFDGLTLPDGAVVVHSPYLVHHDPATVRARRVSTRSAGLRPGRQEDNPPLRGRTRHYPGSNFALLTITLATAALFTRWRATSDPNYRVRPSTGGFVAAPSRVPDRPIEQGG